MTRINQIEPWIGDEEKRAVASYLDSGAWLTEFNKTEEFERMIADYVGSKYACVVSNGTISLVIALMALGIQQGDEVIVPDFTMIASANAVTMVGAKPVLIDIDSSNFCLDLDRTENAINNKTKAIMYVNLNGRSHNMDDVLDLARKHDLFLIEDAAQAMGSRFDGRHLGTFGEIGSFSFSYPKVITTGQGGALVTDNKNHIENIRKIKDFGRPRSGVDLHEMIGLNAKFTDLQAVIGIEQMKKLAWRANRKKEIFKLYRDQLTGIKELEVPQTNLADCSPWFIDVLVPVLLREKLIRFLADREIGVRPFYPAIHTQKPYSWVEGDFQNSLRVSKEGLWLPSSSFLTDQDITRVTDEILKFFQTHKP